MTLPKIDLSAAAYVTALVAIFGAILYPLAVGEPPPAKAAASEPARFREIHKEGFGTAGPDVRIIEDTETGCLYFASWRPVLGADGEPDGCREVSQ